MNKVFKWSRIRRNILECLRNFTDIHYLVSTWVNRESSPTLNFELIYEYLCEDYDFLEMPGYYVGRIVRTPQEAEAVHLVAKELDTVADLYGFDDNNKIIHSLEWEKVKIASINAIQVLCADSSVKLPALRRSVIYKLRDMTDRALLESKPTTAVEILMFFDKELAPPEAPEKNIGVVFRNQQEAEAARAAVKEFRAAMKQDKGGHPEIDLSSLPKVTAASFNALCFMSDSFNDEPEKSYDSDVEN